MYHVPNSQTKTQNVVVTPDSCHVPLSGYCSNLTAIASLPVTKRHVNGITWYVLISFSIHSADRMLWILTDVGAYINHTFLFTAEHSPTVGTNHNSHIRYPVDGYLGFFQFLAIMNKTSTNNSIQIFYGLMFSHLLGKYLRVELLDHW